VTVARGVAPNHARAGETVNIPYNAPHAFKNVSARRARLLCNGVAGRGGRVLSGGWRRGARAHVAAPTVSNAGRAERASKAKAMALRYRNEMVGLTTRAAMSG
jgi:hypothetical protein